MADGARKFKMGEVVLYEGRVFDMDTQSWETLDRGALADQPLPRCVVVHHERGVGVQEHLRVKLLRWPDEPYEYAIFDLDGVRREASLIFESEQEIALVRVMLRHRILSQGLDSPSGKTAARLLTRMEEL